MGGAVQDRTTSRIGVMSAAPAALLPPRPEGWIWVRLPLRASAPPFLDCPQRMTLPLPLRVDGGYR